MFTLFGGLLAVVVPRGEKGYFGGQRKKTAFGVSLLSMLRTKEN